MFSTLPTALGNRCAIPTVPPLRRLDLYKGEAQAASSQNQQLRVGQIKPPKWAKGTCQKHPCDLVGEMVTLNPAAPRSATLKASDPMVALRVDGQDFTIIADRYPSVWRAIARIL